MLDIILFCYTNLVAYLCHLHIKVGRFGLHSLPCPPATLPLQ